jgi:hypothetical protein
MMPGRAIYSMHEYDKSSKWLIQHHGGSILRLGGVRDIARWRALQAEVVQTRRLPDGLLEVYRQGQAEPNLFILEIATYPEARAALQAVRDMTLVYLDREVLPEVLVLVLHPKGNQRVAGLADLQSALGWTRWQAIWRVVELWNVPAQDLLAAGDVGLIPWVPLSHFEGPPDPIFQQCRARIDRDAPPAEHENLLAVTQVLAGLRYNDPRLFQLLGGRQAMIESPVLQELKAEWTHEGACKAQRRNIMDILVARFGAVAEDLSTELEVIQDEGRLRELVKAAALCPDLESFRKRLAPRASCAGVTGHDRIASTPGTQGRVDAGSRQRGPASHDHWYPGRSVRHDRRKP